jgi:oxygen-independent coproporphyrinogen-3 oxidase
MRNSAPGRSARAGLYVHVPFCRTKCAYCDFYSVTERDKEAQWLAAIGCEAALYKDRFAGPFDSIYIGGGTPTSLFDGQLAALLDMLRREFAFSPDCEVTVEANPDDVDEGRLKMLAALGCNRLSFGIQSFDDRELALLKRRHNADRAARAIEAAKTVGFSNIGLDLMYGLPGQTMAGWRATLERALSFGPAHLSCYQLTMEGRTPLAQMVSAGELALPADEEVRALFLETSRGLSAAGFIHYEVSNFALPGRTCRHNEKYWRRVPYLGLGPSAHSFDGRTRWWNHRSLKSYIGVALAGERPVASHEALSAGQIELERLYLGLRTRRGIRLTDVKEKSLLAVRELRRAGLLRRRNGRLVPSPAGYLVADSLPVLLS